MLTVFELADLLAALQEFQMTSTIYLNYMVYSPIHPITLYCHDHAHTYVTLPLGPHMTHTCTLTYINHLRYMQL